MVSQPKVPELDLPAVRPGGPGGTGGQPPGCLGQEGTQDQRSLSPRCLMKWPTSLRFSFPFCKMGVFTLFYRLQGIWNKLVSRIIKIMLALAIIIFSHY